MPWDPVHTSTPQTKTTPVPNCERQYHNYEEESALFRVSSSHFWFCLHVFDL